MRQMVYKKWDIYPFIESKNGNDQVHALDESIQLVVGALVEPTEVVPFHSLSV